MDIYEPTYNGPSWWGAILPLLAYVLAFFALVAIAACVKDTRERRAARRKNT